MEKYISYLRVSTQKQGAEGLGISAQRAMCEQFVRGKGGKRQGVEDYDKGGQSVAGDSPTDGSGQRLRDWHRCPDICEIWRFMPYF